MEKNTRDYAAMDVKQMVESVISDAKKQGTVTIPLRRDGYHTCSNLMFTDLK